MTRTYNGAGKGGGASRAGGKIASQGKKLNPKQHGKKFGKEGRAML